jgi:hypothetical protein
MGWLSIHVQAHNAWELKGFEALYQLIHLLRPHVLPLRLNVCA